MNHTRNMGIYVAVIISCIRTDGQEMHWVTESLKWGHRCELSTRQITVGGNSGKRMEVPFLLLSNCFDFIFCLKYRL